MKWILLILISHAALAQTLEEDKAFCQKVLSDQKSYLIYRVKDDNPDPIGDLALWRTFKMKLNEKIPAVFGNKTQMSENQAVRNLPVDVKERMLRCFHGSNFKLITNERNKLENTFPLLNGDEREEVLKAFHAYMDEEHKLKTIVDILTEALNSAEDKNSKPIALSCPDDLEGKTSKINPLKQRNFDQMFKNVICKTGVKPLIGEEDKWSKEFKQAHLTPPFSKLLVALANGDTNRIMPTMKENELMNWILDQKDRSVTIHEIFEKSYLLNQGNIYKSLMTIENVLSENFFWGGNLRERLTLTTKLSKIINHEGGQFDLYGPWYHLFGMMLYGYAEGSGLKATIVGKIETGTSIFYKERNDKQENYMIAGGRIGARLKRSIKKINSDEDFKKYCKDAQPKIETSDYLNLIK
jgi:hypothetical protein